MLSVLRERASSGLVLGGGLVVLLAALVIGWSLGPLPDGADGANAANMGLTSVMFLGPLTAGVTAAQVARDERGGVLAVARAARRGELGSWLLLITAASGWTVLAYLGLVLAAFFRGASGTMRPPDLALVLPALSLIVLCGAVGVVAGSRHASMRTALGVAAGTFVVLYAGGYLEIWSARWATVYPGTAFPVYLQPNTGLNVGKSLIALALTGALLATASRRAVLKRWSWAASLAGVLLGVVLIVQSPDWPTVPGRTEHPVCDSAGGFTLCAWPEQADRLPAMLHTLAQLEGQVGDVYPLPRDYRQIGAGEPQPGEVLLGNLSDPGRTETVERVMADLAVRSLPAGDCPSAADAAARDLLSAWLQSTTQGMTPIGSEVPPQEVRSWVVRVQRCQR